MADPSPPEPRRFRDTPLSGSEAPGPERRRRDRTGSSGPAAGGELPGTARAGAEPGASSSAQARAPEAPRAQGASAPRSAGEPVSELAGLGAVGERPQDLGDPARAPAFERFPDERPPPARRPSVLGQPEVAWPAGLLAGSLPAQLLAEGTPPLLAAPPAALALFLLELAWRRREAPRADRAGVLGFGLGLLVVAIDRGLASGGALSLGERLGLWPAVSETEPLPALLCLGAPLFALALALSARLPTALPSRLGLALLLVELGHVAGARGALLALPGDGDLLRAWRGLGPLGLALAVSWTLASASGLPAGSRPDRRRDALWFGAGAAVALVAAAAAWIAGS